MIVLQDGIAEGQLNLVGCNFLDARYLLVEGDDGVLRSHADRHPSQHLLVLKDQHVHDLVVHYHALYYIVFTRRKHQLIVLDIFYILVVRHLLYLIRASIALLGRRPGASVETIR